MTSVHSMTDLSRVFIGWRRWRTVKDYLVRLWLDLCPSSERQKHFFYSVLLPRTVLNAFQYGMDHKNKLFIISDRNAAMDAGTGKY